MAIVNTQKIFIFLHQFFHFLLVVFEHRSPPVQFSQTSDHAPRQKARECASLKYSVIGCDCRERSSKDGMRRITALPAIIHELRF
jgi:hypothetical protein